MSWVYTCSIFVGVPKHHPFSHCVEINYLPTKLKDPTIIKLTKKSYQLMAVLLLRALIALYGLLVITNSTYAQISFHGSRGSKFVRQIIHVNSGCHLCPDSNVLVELLTVKGTLQYGAWAAI